MIRYDRQTPTSLEVGLTLPFALRLYILFTPDIEKYSLLVHYFLNQEVFHRLGEFSFAIYGLHMPVGVYFTFIVYGVGEDNPIG